MDDSLDIVNLYNQSSNSDIKDSDVTNYGSKNLNYNTTPPEENAENNAKKNSVDIISTEAFSSQQSIIDDEDNSEEVITTIPKFEGEIIDTLDNYADDAVFQTKDVARFLGLSVQVVRNYAKTYEDVLKISRKGNNEDTAFQRRVWTKKNINQLKSILELKRNNGWNDDKALNYLGEPSSALMKASISDEALEKLSQYLTAEIADKVNAVVMQNIQTQMQLIADNSSSTALIESKLDKLIEKSEHETNLLKEEIESIKETKDAEIQQIKQTKDDEIKEIIQTNEGKLADQKQTYEEQIAALVQKSNEKQEEYQKNQAILFAQIAQLTDNINELKKKQEEPPKKSKRFWFFGKKDKTEDQVTTTALPLTTTLPPAPSNLQSVNNINNIDTTNNQALSNPITTDTSSNS